MNSTTVRETIFWTGVAVYIDSWAKNSKIWQLWDMFPTKQAWRSYEKYTIEPITDNFTRDTVSLVTNQVNKKNTTIADGLLVTITSENVRFDYFKNGLRNGPQRLFLTDKTR